MSEKFEEAYRRARAKIGAAAWRRLSNAEQEAAVAAELRIIEGEKCDRAPDDENACNGT